jgi:hypothetical protein
MTFWVTPSCVVSQTPTTLPGSRYGNGSSSTVRITLKIAAVAPMPMASVASAAIVNPGARHRMRAPNRMSRIESSSNAGLIWSRVSS